jgi:hypothetical protein
MPTWYLKCTRKDNKWITEGLTETNISIKCNLLNIPKNLSIDAQIKTVTYRHIVKLRNDAILLPSNLGLSTWHPLQNSLKSWITVYKNQESKFATSLEHHFKI